MCNMTIFKQPPAAHFPVLIQKFYINNLFHTGAIVSCLSSRCHSNSLKNLKLKKIYAKTTSPDGSDFRPLGIVYCMAETRLQKFHHEFIFCLNILTVYFRVGIDWNSEGKFHLHQDHKFLTYPVTYKMKVKLFICSANCSVVHLIAESMQYSGPRAISL